MTRTKQKYTISDICHKEVEIELIKNTQINMNKKVDDIHRRIIGNGRKGLCTEMSEIRGGIKVLYILITFIIGVVSGIVVYLR